MFDLDPITREPLLNTPQAHANYEHAQQEAAAGRMVDEGIVEHSTRFWDAGAIRCHCGAVVELTDHWEGSTCQGCGTEYGSTGQMFRVNWREVCRETGELDD